MRVRLRDRDREPERRTTAVHETALFHGAAIELSRMGGVIAMKDAEIRRLRALLAEHSIEAPEDGR